MLGNCNKLHLKKIHIFYVFFSPCFVSCFESFCLWNVMLSWFSNNKIQISIFLILFFRFLCLLFSSICMFIYSCIPSIFCSEFFFFYLLWLLLYDCIRLEITFSAFDPKTRFCGLVSYVHISIFSGVYSASEIIRSCWSLYAYTMFRMWLLRHLVHIYTKNQPARTKPKKKHRKKNEWKITIIKKHSHDSWTYDGYWIDDAIQNDKIMHDERFRSESKTIQPNHE